MQPASTPTTDTTARVAGANEPRAPWRIVAVECLGNATVRVSFQDGTAGEARLAAFLAQDRIVGSVFEPLREERYFRQLRLEAGVVTWPNGADLAPDAIYDAIRARGYWNAED